MLQENVDVVRAFIDAGRRGGVDAFMAPLDAAIEWTPVESDPGYAVHRGLDDVEAWLVEWAEVFPDMHWEPERILDAGGAVVVALVRMVGRGVTSGLDLETPAYGVVFTLRSGRIMRIEEYEDASEALETVGLRE